MGFANNKFIDKRIMPFKAIEIFNIVLDVEKYPEFLPWCKNIKITSKKDNTITAESLISFKGIEASYVSTIHYNCPNEKKDGWIEVKSDNGVFKNMLNLWKFTPQGECSSVVEFDIDFQLKSSLMQSITNIMYTKAQKKIIESFYERANKLRVK